MPETKNPSETVDKGNPGYTEENQPDAGGGAVGTAGKDIDAANRKNADAKDVRDDGGKGRKPGEADAPHIPEEVKPSFE
jgi:hypothetical protein